MLHSRIFAVLVHWEISKKNGNWKKNVLNSYTVHRVFMILKSILVCISIQAYLQERPDGLLVLLLIIHAGDRGSIPWATTDHFYLLHWFYLIKSWKINLFFSISCQGTKTVMLLPHTDMIIEQCPTEFCLVHWKKKLKLISTEGWLTYIQLCSYCLLSQMVWIIHNFLLSILA